MGKTQTITEWAAEYKMCRSTLADRLCNGMDLHTALFTPTDRQARITAFDETRKIDDWCKSAKIARNTIYTRRRRGLTDGALVAESARSKGLTAFGKTQSYAAWEKEKGVPKATIYYRVNRAGLSPEVALTLPVDVARSNERARKQD